MPQQIETDIDRVRAWLDRRVCFDFNIPMIPQESIRRLVECLDGVASGTHVIVPKTPTPGLLMSMALRSDHGLGCPGYYDQEIFGEKMATHADMVESAITQMRQLHEEVVGTGFYDPTKEEEYRTFMTIDKPENSVTLEK